MKKYILLFLLFSVLCHLQAQPFNERYIFDLTAVDYSDIFLKQDTIIVLGIGGTWSPVQANPAIGKFDLNGNMLLYNVYDDTLSQYAPSTGKAVIDGNGNILTHGGFGSGFPNRGGYYALYNTNGNLKWFKEIPEPEEQFYFTGGCFLPNGDIFLLGNYFDQDTSSTYLYKADSLGNIKWKKKYICPTISCRPGAIVPESDSTFLMGTWIYQPLAKTRLTRIDTAGNVLFDWQDTQLRTFAPKGIEFTDDGGLIYSTYAWVEVSDQFYGQGMVVKLDKDFELEWRIYTGTSSNITRAYNILPTSDGHYVVVGTTLDSIPLGDEATVSGTVTKFTAEGDVLWERRHFYDSKNEAVQNRLYDIVELPDGDLVACGITLDYLADSFPNRGWLIRMDPNGLVVSNKRIALPSPQVDIRLWPNPASSYVNVETKDRDIIRTLTVVDANGRIQQHAEPNTYTYQLDVSGWKLGMYYVSVNGSAFKAFVH